MNSCSKRYKFKLGFIRIKDKHLFLISNAFYTLEAKNVIELIRTCQDCQFKEVLTLDQETVIECVKQYPSAFKPLLRAFIESWMS